MPQGANQLREVDAAADGELVRLQVAITRLKLRNLPPRSASSWDGLIAASLRKVLLGTPLPDPSGLSLSLRFGSGATLQTSTLPYPSAGEQLLFADDRFTFEHVTRRAAIAGEVCHTPLCSRQPRACSPLSLALSLSLHSASLALHSRSLALAPSSAAPDEHRPSRAASQLLEVALEGDQLESSELAAAAAERAEARAVLGRVRLPLQLLASGPTRNDHPLVTIHDEAAGRDGVEGAGGDSAGSEGGEGGEEAADTPTGARLAFRCRVSELRTWRLQLEKVARRAPSLHTHTRMRVRLRGRHWQPIMPLAANHATHRRRPVLTRVLTSRDITSRDDTRAPHAHARPHMRTACAPTAASADRALSHLLLSSPIFSSLPSSPIFSILSPLSTRPGQVKIHLLPDALEPGDGSLAAPSRAFLFSLS